MLKLLEFWLLAVFFFAQAHSLDNGLALTPPMGWLSWERFRCVTDCKTFPDTCISENLYIAMADQLVAGGYRDLGYVFVNIDDCWAQMTRDNVTKALVPDPIRFPHGIKWLADYMHSKGLKLGIYADYGLFTCGGYPGSMGYLDLDAQTFASWGVDSVKFDGCFADPKTEKIGYPAFGKSLNKTGHPMLYSCEWPLYEWVNNLTSNYSAIAETCNLFRNYNDIDDNYISVRNTINFYAANAAHFLEVAGPGNFLDPDMIIVGDFGLSYEQQKMQLGMWATWAAPLYMSNDLRDIDPESVKLLQNKLMIAIDQDPLGKPGRLAYQQGDVQIWVRTLSGGRFSIAAIYFGTGGTPIRVSMSLADLKVPVNPTSIYTALDVFDQYSLGLFGINDKIPFRINPTGIVFALVAPLTV